ncbi:MAG: patatin-like phospholipase family protein [Nitrospirae bacterium]|nr:patatin-like phospholipase family protein [Nitrospirota bacterium]
MTDRDAKGAALALSGGAARCAGHIGVLDVLARANISIDAIAGTSGGAFVGALHASGRYTTAQIEALALEMTWRRLLAPSLSRRGFWSSEKIGAALRRILGAATFADLKHPFVAVACDLRTGELVVLAEGDVARAVQASCSLPVVFTPTTIGGRVLVDGGAVSQLPVLAARAAFPGSVVVGVDVNCGAAEAARLTNMVRIGVQVVSLFARQNAARERRHADVMIDVDASEVPLYDLRKMALMVGRGRDAAVAALDAVRRALGFVDF